mmetsp:Transcript_14451/g.50269  ORF Transcript_14451/g.50269 Transcript_14451/m.50269 type:complete len:256 (-) Transcript_14451:243-1010(-)
MHRVHRFTPCRRTFPMVTRRHQSSAHASAPRTTMLGRKRFIGKAAPSPSPFASDAPPRPAPALILSRRSASDSSLVMSIGNPSAKLTRFDVLEPAATAPSSSGKPGGTWRMHASSMCTRRRPSLRRNSHSHRAASSPWSTALSNFSPHTSTTTVSASESPETTSGTLKSSIAPARPASGEPSASVMPSKPSSGFCDPPFGVSTPSRASMSASRGIWRCDWKRPLASTTIHRRSCIGPATSRGHDATETARPDLSG